MSETSQSGGPIWVFRLTSGVAARLVPLGVLLFVGSVVLYAVIASGPLGSAAVPPALALAGLVVLVVVVHEALHVVGFVAFGGRPHVGFAIKGGVPYAFAASPGTRYSRRQFLVIGLLPLVVIDLLALAAATQPPLAAYGLLAFATNTSGAIGDLWMIALVLQSPEETRFEDPEGTTMVAYLEGGATPSRPWGLDPRGGEWLVWGLLATPIAALATTLLLLELALKLNGGRGGTLSIAGIFLASASPGHGRMNLGAVLVIAAVVGLAGAAAVRLLRRPSSAGDQPRV